MLKTMCLAATAAVIVSTSALADYYVVQERATGKCRVVETRPTETTWIQIGPLAFKTRDEAERQVVVLCKAKQQ